jgi:uncharacterized protein DUF6220
MLRYFRWIYFGWLALTVAAIVLQFYLAGYGVFGFNGLNGFGAHFVVGDLIGLSSIVGIGLAFAAREPWRTTGLNGLFFVLMVIQVILAHTGVQVISALHVVNGVLIFGLVAYLTRAAYRYAMQETAPTAAAAVSAPAR